MPRPLRHFDPGQLCFVTSRTFQARYLLRPGTACLASGPVTLALYCDTDPRRLLLSSPRRRAEFCPRIVNGQFRKSLLFQKSQSPHSRHIESWRMTK